MKRSLFGMLIPLLFLTVGLLPSERADAQRGHFSPNSSALDLITEVNALRTSNDLPSYQVNSILMSIAQAHADAIAGTGIVTHFDANGLRPYQRAIEAGYLVAGDLSLGGFFDENIHAGANLSPAGAVTFWKGDANQLNTMLSADFEDVGAGMAIAKGVTYYVLNAGSESGVSAAISTPTISSSEFIISTAGAAGTPAVVVMVSTPFDNGEIYHVVQKNEALWSIAIAYGTTIEQLKLLNVLVTDEIFEEQTLLVKKPVPLTATPSPAVTATFGIPTSTATIPVTPTVTSTATPLPKAPASLQNGGMVVGVIIVIALLGAGLGSLLGRKKVE
ncbi:MAG: CAP domain-containing protein [Anaerolineales bacterium]|nr:CAP domain-containing protein [Anaerolineales bacterium]